MTQSITLIVGGEVSLGVNGDDVVAFERCKEVVEKPPDTVAVAAPIQSFEGPLPVLIFGSCTKSHDLVITISSSFDLP